VDLAVAGVDSWVYERTGTLSIGGHTFTVLQASVFGSRLADTDQNSEPLA